MNQQGLLVSASLLQAHKTSINLVVSIMEFSFAFNSITTQGLTSGTPINFSFVKQNAESTMISVSGLDSWKAGFPDIKNKVHFIRPDGNSDQFRKGAW